MKKPKLSRTQIEARLEILRDEMDLIMEKIATEEDGRDGFMECREAMQKLEEELEELDAEECEDEE